MIFWREVFETHRKIMGTSSKAKSDSQIRKWLEDPHSAHVIDDGRVLVIRSHQRVCQFLFRPHEIGILAVK